MYSFYLSAAHKSSGKTTLSIALSKILSKNYRVQTFKKGPDYIDPSWLKLASGKACYNLDFYTMSPNEIKNLYTQNSQEVNIIEGNKGLYDGVTTLGGDANADLAKLLNLPVILIVDSIGITRGIAPLLQGYQNFDKKVNITGVILNKVGGIRHETKLINAIQEYTDLQVLGSVHKSSDLLIQERCLGLIPANEDAVSQKNIRTIANKVKQQIDIDKILQVTKNANKFANKPVLFNKASNLTVAIAKDSTFGFYYADDLQAFQQLGVTIQYFDSLKDKKLPNCDGLFIGGGFPETHLASLSCNTNLLGDIKHKIISGLPTYAECGGLMYLTNNITYDNKTYKMAGVINADTIMTAKPIGRGYTQLEPTQLHPWGVATHIKSHEFHYSQLINLKENKFAFKVSRGIGIDGKVDGIIKHNLLATYTHQRNVNSHWIVDFMSFIKTKL